MSSIILVTDGRLFTNVNLLPKYSTEIRLISPIITESFE